MLPGEPVEVKGWECVLEVGGRGSGRIEIWRCWKARVFRGAYTPQKCGEGRGQVCVERVMWSLGRPARGEYRGCSCRSRMGMEARDPDTVLSIGAQRTGAGIPLSTHIYPFQGLWALHW